MQFHKHMSLLNHLLRGKIGISESLITIGADLTNLDQGYRIDKNVGHFKMPQTRALYLC